MAGKQRRLGRIFAPDGRAVIVPVDHALTEGPIEGLQDLPRSLRAIGDGQPDAIVIHRGAVEQGLLDAVPELGLIVHLSGGSTLSGAGHLKALVCRVEDAVRLGADAVSVHLTFGAGDDRPPLEQLAQVASASAEWQMPLLAMIYLHDVDPSALATATAHAARIAAELGADAVKVGHPGTAEGLAQVVEGCFVPVLIAGGPSRDPDVCLQGVASSLELGASGVCLGRNAFQRPDPAAFLSALRTVVHPGVGVRVLSSDRDLVVSTS